MIVVSAHALHREGLQAALEESPGWTVSALDDAEQVGDRADVVLLDLLLPDLTAAIGALRQRARVAVWGGYPSSHEVRRLVERGVDGYLSALGRPHEVRRMVAVVDSGERSLPDLATSVPKLAEGERRAAVAYAVTWPELSRAEVAARLGISENTLKAQLVAVRRKFGPEASGPRAELRRVLHANGVVPVS